MCRHVTWYRLIRFTVGGFKTFCKWFTCFLLGLDDNTVLVIIALQWNCIVIIYCNKNGKLVLVRSFVWCNVYKCNNLLFCTSVYVTFPNFSIRSYQKYSYHRFAISTKSPNAVPSVPEVYTTFVIQFQRKANINAHSCFHSLLINTYCKNTHSPSSFLFLLQKQKVKCT